MQETKLADADAPAATFRDAGYELAHHGEGRWNGVAIASRCGIDDVVTNFGEPLRPAKTADVGDDEPLAEARMIAAVCGGVRVVCVYAPNGRVVDSPFYEAKLAWYERLSRWLAEARRSDRAAGARRRLQRRAGRRRRLGSHAPATAGRTSRRRSAPPSRALCSWGLVDAYRLHHPEAGRYTWWDYRAGNFHKNFGMRIDHLLVTPPLAERMVWAEIDREARKGKPIPSDHAPLVIDLDEPGQPFDAGWKSAEGRIAARLTGGALMGARTPPPFRSHRRSSRCWRSSPSELPPGDGWLFEPKWDGFRAIVFRDRDHVYVQSRDLKPLDRYFPELATTLARQPAGALRGRRRDRHRRRRTGSTSTPCRCGSIRRPRA